MPPAVVAGEPGEMLARVRAYDWTQTPLGSVESWPTELRVAVDICLSSRFPMFVWWGPQRINVYNDGYIPMLGERHPAALGRPAQDTWDDIWDVVGPQADAVTLRGEATWNERVRLVMERKGYWEDTYFTWSYSPIRDHAGHIGGLFCAVTEETAHVMSEARDALLLALDQEIRPLTDPRQITAACARLLGEHLGADRCAYADVEADQDTFNLTGDYNRGVPSIVGRYRFADFGQEVLRLMREDKPYVVEDVDTHQPPVGDLAYYRQTVIRSVICVPMHKAGRFVAAMAVHQTTPRRWMPDEVDLVRHVAARCWESIERARVERTLRENEGRLRALVNATTDVVYRMSPDWTEMRALGGRGFIPDTDKPTTSWIDQYIHPEDQPRVLAAIRQAVRTKSVFELEHRVLRVNGSIGWTLSRAVPLLDANGEITEWIGAASDVTGHKLAEEERRRHTTARDELLARERAARADAERASEAKSEFLATLSHELRTPLTPVLLTVSLMESHPQLPADLRDDVATIRRNVELESRLISDLLDLTRVAQGKLQLDEQDVDLHLVVRSAVDICQREASARLNLELRAARHTVRGDATRLQQVFWNLINNAIKFTPPDGTITVRSSDGDDGRVRVEVIDTGAGIDASVLPRLFNAFEQGEARAARQFAGLGLGLAISRKLTEAQGGTINAGSDGRGHGSTFSVELPVLVDGNQHTATAPPERPSLTTPRRLLDVLLVEDHEATLRALERLLRTIGHRVTGVTSVASATAAASRSTFDVIISDLGLPDGSGLEFMRHVRERYAGRAIALTGYGMESDVAASRDAGFTEHLIKPVDLQQLQSVIARIALATQPQPRD